MKKIIVLTILLASTICFAADCTCDKEKLENAQLKQALIQVQEQLMQFQYQSMQADKAKLAEEVKQLQAKVPKDAKK